MSNVHHTRNLVLNLPFDQAYDFCIDSVCKIKRSKITQEDRANGRIAAKAGITWKSFGDQIEFEVKKIDENHTNVEFSSRPAVRATLVDYGKNLQNVQIIEAALKEHRLE